MPESTARKCQDCQQPADSHCEICGTCPGEDHSWFCGEQY